MAIINVWHEDFVHEHLFMQLVSDIAHAMGIRIRVRSKSFESRRRLLRSKLFGFARHMEDGGVHDGETSAVDWLI